MKKYLLLCAVLSTTAHAGDTLQPALQKLCKKTQRCAIEQMRATLPPEMVKMAEAMAGAQLCQGFAQTYEPALTGENKQLLHAAEDCINSMNALICEALLNEPNTAACQKYEQMLEQYSQE